VSGGMASCGLNYFTFSTEAIDMSSLSDSRSLGSDHLLILTPL
jgi:hypothetical protein